MNIDVKVINQLSDNYCYIAYSSKTKKALVVDPAQEEPIINYIKKNNLEPLAILITHHHHDHTSGIRGLTNHYKIEVYSSNKDIDGSSIILKDKEKINFGFIDFEILSTPGHTLDHIVYYSQNKKILFSGDTLFHYGCGRVFEGTYQQMLNSLNKLKLA